MTPPEPAPGDCAAVLVCGGRHCATHTDEALETLRPLIRLAPRSVLLRTECPGACSAGPPAGARDPVVVLQRCDARLRARARPRVVRSRDLCDVRRQVARWLLSEDADAR